MFAPFGQKQRLAKHTSELEVPKPRKIVCIFDFVTCFAPNPSTCAGDEKISRPSGFAHLGQPLLDGHRGERCAAAWLGVRGAGHPDLGEQR
jgi:hypothetical protein